MQKIVDIQVRPVRCFRESMKKEFFHLNCILQDKNGTIFTPRKLIMERWVNHFKKIHNKGIGYIDIYYHDNEKDLELTDDLEKPYKK